MVQFLYSVLDSLEIEIALFFSARLFIQDGKVSSRSSCQNTPPLHAKTQGAIRVQQFAC